MKVSVTYKDLVTQPFCMGRLLARNPTVVVVTGTPDTEYARRFAEHLKAAKELPCDRPHKVFCMKPAPEFIFLVDKSVSNGNNTRSHNDLKLN